MYSSQQDHGLRYHATSHNSNLPHSSFLPPKPSYHQPSSSQMENPMQQPFSGQSGPSTQPASMPQPLLHPRLPPLGPLNTAQPVEVRGVPGSEISPGPGSGNGASAPVPSWSVSNTVHGRTYRLDVAQQPVRARMCGFGDKDRRPITPPPCIRLIVTDEKTGSEIDINELEANFHVLTVDLWSPDGKRELNMVRHSMNSPSISATSTTSFPPPPITHANVYPGMVVQPNASAPGYQHQAYPQSQYQQPNGYHQGFPSQPQSHSQHHYMSQGQPQQQSYIQNPPNGYYSQVSGVPPQQVNGNVYGYPPTSPTQPGPNGLDPHANGMYTRNLIGSLCANAFKLTDPDEKLGEWFVLQDLSVRTEGTFRLKFNFVNIMDKENPQQVSHGACPVLASIFSDEFTVFSAKKFPGVIESTAISKCFATQGIKIPIRKDGPRGNVRENSNENEDD